MKTDNSDADWCYECRIRGFDYGDQADNCDTCSANPANAGGD